MFTWRMAKGSKLDWILIEENTKEVRAYITVSEKDDGTYDTEAKAQIIGYSVRFENVSKEALSASVHFLKRSIKYALGMFNCDFIKPETKKVYEMIDDIPVWKHLKDGSSENKILLRGGDYGKFAEILGKRVLHDRLERLRIIYDIFPDIKTDRVHFVKTRRRPRRKEIKGVGDGIMEIDYKKDESRCIHGKKIIIFEIKHGRMRIEQNQLRNYARMVLNPDDFFKKADEVKVVYMMFDDINTTKGYASYYIQELDKEFAKSILEREPVEPFERKYESIEEGMPGLISM